MSLLACAQGLTETPQDSSRGPSGLYQGLILKQLCMFSSGGLLVLNRKRKRLEANKVHESAKVKWDIKEDGDNK